MLEKYTIVKTIGDSHSIYLVKNIQDNLFYVKKVLNIYDKNVYEWLYKHHINGIPTIKEIYEEDNKLIIIEEYISGKTLETILEESTLSEKEVRQIIINLCKILKDITDKITLVHRDIKPANIILKDNNELYLIDFNTAKISNNAKTRDTILLGTEGYAAPEQYGFASSNIQTDIYAIGVLMKEMISGNIDLNENYNSKLKPIIQKCTMMDPKKRYFNYDELINQLKHNNPISRLYLPVGFRSGNPIYMFLFGFLYLFIIFLSKNVIFEGISGLNLTIDRICFGFSLIFIIFFSGNYLNCQEKIKLNKIKNPFIKIVIIILIDVLIFILMFISTAIIGNLLFS